MITDSTTQGLLTGDAFWAHRSNPAIPEHDEPSMASNSRGEPVVPPGTDAVRLTVDGRVAETEVEVRRNPWITDVTAGDLVAQHEFGVRIRDRVDAANSAVIAIRGVKAQLDERLAATGDDETLIAAADGGLGSGSGHLPGAEPVEPGPAELPDQGEQAVVDVGARGRAARKRDVRRVRDHGGAVGG